MSEDGFLPKSLLKLHPRYGTPWVALIVSSLIYTVFILGPFQALVVVDVTIYAGALLLEFAAFVVLRIKEPDMDRPYRVRGGWFGVILVVALPTAVIALAVYLPGIFRGLAGLDRHRHDRAWPRAHPLSLPGGEATSLGDRGR